MRISPRLLLAALIGGSALAAPIAAAKPPRSLCLPPSDSTAEHLQHLGSVSFRAPEGYSFQSGRPEVRMFVRGTRYFVLTTNANRMFAPNLDDRVTCRTSINGREVIITAARTQLEASQPLTPPGVIGVQQIAIAEWVKPVDGHEVMAFILSRFPEDLERFRNAFWSVRVDGDSSDAARASAAPLARPASPWKTVATDTIGALLLETQAHAGRIRFAARGVGTEGGVTTPDFASDSVKAWGDAIDALVRAPSTTMHPLGGSVGAAGTTVDGKQAVALYFGEEMSDQTVSLAVTLADAAHLASAIRAGVVAASHAAP